jgi:hypothetical protein
MDALTAAVAAMLAGRGDVTIEATATRVGLTIEPPAAPSRYLRVQPSGARYAILWCAYRADDEPDNARGRCLGDLEYTLALIRHWIVDGTHWRDVPELDMPGHDGSISAFELLAFYDAIVARTVELVADEDPQRVYAGNVVYRGSNGWVLTIFNDCNEYDYVDEVLTPDGRTIDYDELELTAVDWSPDDATAWKALGIPGYCRTRCTVCGADFKSPEPYARTYLCGVQRCAGLGQPPDGTWLRVKP